MRGTILRRLLCMMLVVAMLSSYALPAFAADDATVKFEQVANDAVSAKIPGREPVELPEEESPYADTDVVRVSIILKKAGTIEAGFPAINIAGNSAAMAYRHDLEKEQVSMVSKIETAIRKDLDVVWNLTLAANIISANVAYGDIASIEKIAGVKSVVIETRYEPDVVSTGTANPDMATSGKQIGSAAAWAAGYTGAGSKIAVIDTGADVEHEAFDSAAFDYSISQLEGEYDLMDSADIAAVLSELHAYDRAGVSAADLYVNSKVPFGFNYIDQNLDIVHVNDSQGEHGSHVAGIATANAYVSNDDGTFSSALDTTFVQGVAPDAQLMVMKVFGKGGGAYDSDYMAAIEDAVILGADSVNLSLGSGNPGMSRVEDAYKDIMESLQKSGVVVAMSAGNSGYWAESAENGIPYLYLDDVSFQTDGSPGSYTNSFTVASVDNDGFTATYFDVDGNIVAYNDNLGFGNDPMTSLAGTQEFVFVNAIGNLSDFEAVGIDNLTGKIVMCYRGEISFFEKANNAAAAGAAGVVVVNNQDGIINMDLTGYNYTAPCVSITQAAGEIFKALGTANTTDSGITYWTGSMEVTDSLGTGQYDSEYYTMSTFSSWGVPGSLELKPEITAPGGNIYSVAGAINNGSFSDHASYEVMSGTSMASPQVAGMAAVMAQYIRETGLDKQTGLDERTLTQSLLMSTAVPLRDANSEGNYYPVIQQGAGLANVGAATTADSYILMKSDATDSYADGKVKAELGDDPEKSGVYSFSFTLNNLTDEEKEFVLSADVFTQDAFEYSGILLQDTWTRNLNPSVTWKVNGASETGGNSTDGMDFNGDGNVDEADGQSLLDYATGKDVTLSNASKADLNGDGDVTSYDAYLFFTRMNAGSMVLPANGSVAVTVTITLSATDRNWLANYENGAYIEGYIHAETLTTEEGEGGTVHSIPMLAYYGNWSDPSMFDKGSYVEYNNNMENRPPYLYYSAFNEGLYNGLLVKYSDMDGEYWFGGNPMVTDDTYMPERNAFSNARGDILSRIGFTAIRNAADSYVQILNSETGEAYLSESLGEYTSAFYYVNAGYWYDTFYTLALGLQPDVAENTSIDVNLTLVPEYYADGTVDFDALGDGATLSMPMVIDNTAPVVSDVNIDTENGVLTVTAADNQYISAVALYDIYGQYLYTYCGSDADQSAGDTVNFALDLSDVNGPSFLLQVYDYAMNAATYEITTQIGEVVDTVESIELTDTELTLQLNNTKKISAVVYPVNASSRGVVWSTADESIASVDENGVVTANAVGTTTITATAAADASVTAVCDVEVVDIAGTLNGIVWDEEGSIWFSEFAVNDLPNYTKLSPDMLETDYFTSTAVTSDGTLYASTLNTETASGALYTIDPATFAASKISDIMVQGMDVFYADLTYAPAMFETGAMLGVYGPYVVAFDPATGEALGVIDQYDSDLVGIALADTLLSTADDGTVIYQDLVYLIQNDGTVILENYYGYAGDVVPYYDYFEGGRLTMDTGVDVGSAWYFNSAYYDNNYLYWSAFDVETENAVSLYTIDVDNTGNVYSMGQFADSVWPVSGLFEMDAAYTGEAAVFEEAMANMAGREIQTADIQLVAKEIPAAETKAGGSLNAMGGETSAAAPMSKSEISESTDTVTVTVTAKDASGADVASHNGVITVGYYEDVLELTNIQVAGDYTCVVEDEGFVTFGYVSMIGLDPDQTVATLTFTVKENENTAVDVAHLEVNDEKPAYDESLTVELVAPIDAPVISVSNIVSSGANKITWNAVAGASEYFVEYSTDGQTFTHLNTVPGTQLIHAAAEAGKTYYYRVRAIAAEGKDSAYSNVVSRVRKLAQPVVMTTANIGSVEIFWDAVEGAVGYYVEYSLNGSDYDSIAYVNDTKLIRNAVPGVSYYYKVQAVCANEAGNSAFSDAVIGVARLEAPVVTATSAAGNIEINWNAVDGAIQYVVEYSTDGLNFIPLNVVTKPGATHTGVIVGQTYYYRVRAICASAAGDSEYSEVVSAVFEAAAPEAPVVKGSNVATTGKVKLTWAAVENAAKYQVYRATSKSGPYKLMKSTTGTSYINTSSTAGTTYYYYVVAVAANGLKSEQSNIVTRTCDLPRPEVSVSNVASSGKVRLTWEAVEGAVKYKVYRSTSKDGTYSLMLTTTGTTYTNTSAKAGVTYYYKVVAVAEKTAANSAYSSVKSRTCDLPRPVVSIALKNGKPRLTWKAVDGAVSYKIYRSTSKDGTYTLMKTTTGTSYTNTSAKSGVTYYYKVVAVHSKSAANSAYSLVDSIKAK